jgi:hypothetical protein
MPGGRGVSNRRVTAMYLIRTRPQKEGPDSHAGRGPSSAGCVRYDRHDKGDERPNVRRNRTSPQFRSAESDVQHKNVAKFRRALHYCHALPRGVWS